MEKYIQYFVISFVMGLAGRFYLLRIDYRQYPSYPRGVIMHLTFGGIGAALGSIAIPAFLEKNYAAVTVLTLAAEQFRNIRTMERENLTNIEELEMVKRGNSYIEEISKTFEARNYVVVLTSLSTSSILHIFNNIYIGILVGIFVLIILKYLMKGQRIQEIANVRMGEIWFKGSLLYIDDIVMMNVGLKDSQTRILKTGIAVILEPRDENANISLSNMGQRQAIIHDTVAQLGIRKDIDEPDFTPTARRNVESGNMVIIFYPYIKDEQTLLKAVRYAPVLESTRRSPSQSGATENTDAPKGGRI